MPAENALPVQHMFEVGSLVRLSLCECLIGQAMIGV